eukprot:8161766-Pyramimonas_sp.AAC.1
MTCSSCYASTQRTPTRTEYSIAHRSWPDLLKSKVDWGYKLLPQKALKKRPLDYPQGKGLGGRCNPCNTSLLNRVVVRPFSLNPLSLYPSAFSIQYSAFSIQHSYLH